MTEKELTVLIHNLCDYGVRVVQDFGEDKFESYLSLLAVVIQKSEYLLVDSTNDRARIMIEKIKFENIDNYKLNLLEKLFYFKKYQYMFNENIITNKPRHIKKRFILEVNEKLNIFSYLFENN